MGENLQRSLINGKYRLVTTLGQGGMGVVYLADELDEHGAVERQVALKTILPEWSSNRAFTERFEREVKAMKRLMHRHIVPVYESGRDEQGNLYYVMPYLKAPTLKQVLTQGTLPVPRITTIAIQISDALAAMHEQGIVHRDLKPANIFIKQEDEGDFISIGDFGIVRVLDDTTTTVHHGQDGALPPPIGTQPYMAPEQWQRDAIDGRTDLYALGIVLYEMLIGKRPFTGNQVTLREQHLHGMPSPLPDSVPPPLAHLVLDLLQKAPEQRPRDARQVRQRLEEPSIDLQGPTPKQSVPSPILPTPKKEPPKSVLLTRRLLLLTLGGVSGLLILFSPLMLTQGKREQFTTEAIQQWREAAMQGDAVAQFNLGVVYGEGKGVAQNLEEAVRWYRQAAEQGYAAAQNNLGTLYLQGQGVPQNIAEAEQWYNKAAKQSYMPAYVSLGDIAMHSQNYGAARRWFQLAAEQGDAAAAFKLGMLHDQGLGLRTDKSQALAWYKKAADQGHREAQTRYQKLMGVLPPSSEGAR